MANNIGLKNTLLSLIIFLKHKAEEKDLKPVISIAKLIDLLKGTGLKITYQQIVDLTKSPEISSSIKSINKNQIEFNIGTEEIEQNEEPQPTFDDQDFNPNSESEDREDEGDSEESDELNPEDFEAPEDKESESSETENKDDDFDEKQESRKDLISSMAKRAASRS